MREFLKRETHSEINQSNEWVNKKGEIKWNLF
jgi:hypothetical protein